MPSIHMLGPLKPHSVGVGDTAENGHFWLTENLSAAIIPVPKSQLPNFQESCEPTVKHSYN